MAENKNDRKMFTLRTSDINIEKLNAIAVQSKRSANAQLELILEQYIATYEKENGPVQINERTRGGLPR